MSNTTTIPTAPTRADIAHIVTTVFDDACVDPSVIEEIWAAIVQRHSEPVEILSKTHQAQAPVAWNVGGRLCHSHPSLDKQSTTGPKAIPLYATSPQLRNLSDDEISECWNSKLWKSASPHHEFARAILAKAREKV